VTRDVAICRFRLVDGGANLVERKLRAVDPVGRRSDSA
jgi:hypothetical protein